jgi:ribosomal protein S18 acetylase RimI-like enzyme
MRSDDLRIVPAKPEQAREIAEVHVAGWRWGYRDQLPNEVLDGLSVDERETEWRNILAVDDHSERVFVATQLERVVGFASFGTSGDDDAASRTGELFALYLLEEAAGRGVGRALLERAEGSLRGRFDRATLWVLESNARARRFYEAAGWMWDGTTSEHRFDCGNRPIVRYAKEFSAEARRSGPPA